MSKRSAKYFFMEIYNQNIIILKSDSYENRGLYFKFKNWQFSIFIINRFSAMMMDIQQPNLEQENERIFMDYLTKQAILDPLNFTFDLDHFRSQSPIATQDIIRNPTKYYKSIRNYLEKQYLGDEKRKYEAKIDHYEINFEGNLGSNFVTPRGMGSKMANQLVGVQGIVTKMDLIRSQLQKSVHWCEKTKSYEVKEYPDNYAPEKQFEANKTRFIRTFDDNNNPLEFEYGLSSFRNIQQIVIQQLPQMAPPGLLPQSVNVILQGSLVNTVKPGDRVQMIGIYKLIAGSQSKEKGIFKPVFLCLSIKPLNMVITSSKFNSKFPCSEGQLFKLFSRSIAPSIHGHDQLKKAVLLQLLGGCEKNLDNGTHLRGDINVLMVGDPGTAKSQILRWVLSTVDLGIGTTGSGASGVGLTAAIVNDRQTGQKSLEAGAMVLADRGIVCIDQFDKMNDSDRVAVHEVMEQQTVTIAKAGIHCSLNARCSVIAAANPIFGEYQTDKPPTKNIGMQDSLLSRFDLIFIILDEKDLDKDKKIAERVCRNHRLAPTTTQVFNQLHEDDEFIIQPAEQQKQEENIFQKSNVFKSDSKTQILNQAFLKKYINYCKMNIFPVLTDDSITLLSHLWGLLRQKDLDDGAQTKVLPITIRSYETLIRISTAHAKLRQSNTIELSDCIEGFRLMTFCLYGSEDALNDDLNQILKDNTLEVEYNKEENEKKTAKGKGKKKQEDIVKRIEKIEIGKEQKQADRVIQMATRSVKPEKEKLTMVFKAATQIKNRKREDYVTVAELAESLGRKMNEIELEEVLKSLSDQGNIHYIENEKKIYM